MYRNKIERKVHLLRLVRKFHKILGLLMLFFLIIISVTGILLGLKKHTSGNLLPATQIGISNDPKHWLPLDSLINSAEILVYQKLKMVDINFERIDIRTDKGVAKFTFPNSFYELQLDLATGNLLSISKRNSDLIEEIHDGSIIDRLLNIDKEYFKLFYTLLLGLGLFCFALSGFYIWYGPRSIRILRKRANNEVIL